MENDKRPADMAAGREKLAILGKMSAGLAHELNNPATAANRAASELRGVLEAIKRNALQYDCRFEEDERAVMRDLLDVTLQARQRNAMLGPLERADAEAVVADWLSARGVEEADSVAADLLDGGVPQDALMACGDRLRPSSVAACALWLQKLLRLQSLVEDIEQSTGRIREVVRAMKSFLYSDPGTRGAVDVNASIESSLMLFAWRVKRGVQVVRQYARDLPSVSGWSGELHQVWTNLIDNAIDAMEEQGTLTVRTGVDDDGRVRVEIQDSGPGLSAEARDHLFEPFFTTKPAGKGTGLGLDICRRIITERHGGDITADADGAGTRFVVRLPVDGG